MTETQQPRQAPLFPDEKQQIELPARLGRTDVTYRPAREILTRASGFIGGYDFTLNPYSGYGFGCTYCYAAFFTRSREQQDRWGLWVNAKENAARLLGELRPGELDGKPIYMSSVTDPYQPLERKLELTRSVLEVLAGRHRPRLVVQTRSPLALRDADLFREIERKGGRVQVNMTVTTDDEDVRMTFEPGCPSNPARLKAIGKIHQAGVQSCVTLTPLLLVQDTEAFAGSLLATGVRRFIAQTFHFRKGEFVAQTRQAALDIMAEKLGCTARDLSPGTWNTTGEPSRPSGAGCRNWARDGRASRRRSEVPALRERDRRRHWRTGTADGEEEGVGEAIGGEKRPPSHRPRGQKRLLYTREKFCFSENEKSNGHSIIPSLKDPLCSNFSYLKTPLLPLFVLNDESRKIIIHDHSSPGRHDFFSPKEYGISISRIYKRTFYGYRRKDVETVGRGPLDVGNSF